VSFTLAGGVEFTLASELCPSAQIGSTLSSSSSARSRSRSCGGEARRRDLVTSGVDGGGARCSSLNDEATGEVSRGSAQPGRRAYGGSLQKRRRHEKMRR
jgi:hypothetical protein